MKRNQTSDKLLATIAYPTQVKCIWLTYHSLPQRILLPKPLHRHGAHQAPHVCKDHDVCCGVVQFDNEISKDLRPRLERTGDADLLQPFLEYFSGRSFQIGTSLLALWEGKCAAAAARSCIYFLQTSLAGRGHL